MAWCYDHDVPIIPRGGGTGFTGGAVPLDGGVVLSLENLRKIRHLDPGLSLPRSRRGWSPPTCAAGRARPGCFTRRTRLSRQSQIGGNIATNAGGPHAFKYGVTGAWITGLEFVLAPGELVRVGGPIRKDVAGYDLKSLMIGSEGTLGIITAAWVKLIPAPEAALPLAALYPDTEDRMRRDRSDVRQRRRPGRDRVPRRGRRSRRRVARSRSSSPRTRGSW